MFVVFIALVTLYTSASSASSAVKRFSAYALQQNVKTGGGERETGLRGAVVSFGDLLGRNLFGQDRPPYAHCGYREHQRG